MRGKASVKAPSSKPKENEVAKEREEQQEDNQDDDGEEERGKVWDDGNHEDLDNSE